MTKAIESNAKTKIGRDIVPTRHCAHLVKPKHWTRFQYLDFTDQSGILTFPSEPSQWSLQYYQLVSQHSNLPQNDRKPAGLNKAPTAEAIALAGFHYKPQAVGSDNVVCYLCSRALDGWEPDDDPLEEHLKFSPDCGYAICQSIAQSEGAKRARRESGEEPREDEQETEDPTSERLVEARRKTFEIGWPHETKRGWTCKTEKMVEAGWHFAPTEECEDFASCSWCKLGLDGWEPKDDPFEEHHRRAPECPFFSWAGITAPSRRPKAKKGRASKSRTSNARTSNARTSRVSRASQSSRLSTQSMTSAQSDGPDVSSIPDLDESIDTSTTSVMSTMSTASTANNKGKRKAGGRAKGKTTKKAKTTRSTRMKKTESESDQAAEISADQVMQEPERIQSAQVTSPELLEIPTQAEDTQPEPTPPPSPSPQKTISYPPINKHLSEVDEDSDQTPRPISSPLRARSSPAPPKQPTPHRTIPQEQQQPISPNFSISPASDAENAPPSSLPPSSRPPPSTPGNDQASWTPIDIDIIFAQHPTPAKPLFALGSTAGLSEEEKHLTVQEWIGVLAGKAEDELKLESERVVGVFEAEGLRARGKAGRDRSGLMLKTRHIIEYAMRVNELSRLLISACDA